MNETSYNTLNEVVKSVETNGQARAFSGELLLPGNVRLTLPQSPHPGTFCLKLDIHHTNENIRDQQRWRFGLLMAALVGFVWLYLHTTGCF